MPNTGSKYGTYKLPTKPTGGKPGYGARRVQVAGANWSGWDKRTEFIHNPPNPGEDVEQYGREDDMGVGGPHGSYFAHKRWQEERASRADPGYEGQRIGDDDVSQYAQENQDIAEETEDELEEEPGLVDRFLRFVR